MEFFLDKWILCLDDQNPDKYQFDGRVKWKNVCCPAISHIFTFDILTNILENPGYSLAN